jgi:hypothetical protein
MRATIATKSKLRQAENTGNQLDETLAILRNVIKGIAYDILVPSKPRPSVTRINDFAIQVALVMTGIRSGYLVDTLTLRFEYLANFLEVLQQVAPSDLAVCWEATCEQVFFINSRLLKSRIALKDFPSWISVTQPPSLVSIGETGGSLPTDLHKTLEPLCFSPFLQIMLEVGYIHKLQARSPFDGCPLAAFLLEYPVAYVIETDSLPFLSDVSLCVYECTFDLLGERCVT